MHPRTALHKAALLGLSALLLLGAAGCSGDPDGAAQGGNVQDGPAAGGRRYRILDGDVTYSGQATRTCTFPQGECLDQDGPYREARASDQRSTDALFSMDAPTDPAGEGPEMTFDTPLAIDSWAHGYTYKREMSITPCGIPESVTATDSNLRHNGGPTASVVVEPGATPRDVRVSLRPMAVPPSTIDDHWNPTGGCGATSTTTERPVLDRSPFDFYPEAKEVRQEVRPNSTVGPCTDQLCVVRAGGAEVSTYRTPPEGDTISGQMTVTWWFDVEITEIDPGPGATTTSTEATSTTTSTTEPTCRERPERNPVVCYAPLVRLHPDEITFPMDIADFVASSRLMWNRDHGCDDEVVAEQIDAARIGKRATDPYTAQEAGWPGCDPAGHVFAASDLTKPGQEGKDHGLDKEEGFYLDLADDHRLGALPTDGKVRAGAYYSLSPDKRHITYWFMYGYNQGSPRTGTYVDHHEGEWERATVDLAADGTATQVRYWQHECAQPETVPYEDVETVGTHPVVYSALGSHASFPDVRYVDNDGLCPLDQVVLDVVGVGQGWGDTTARGGYVWETWATSLSNAADQPWYGFGGAWGEIGGNEKRGDPCLRVEDITSGRAPCLTDVNGPLGPDHKNLFAYP